MTAGRRVDLDIEIPVLNGLSPESLALLLTEANVINLRPGQDLFHQGEPASAFFIVLSGLIKLYRVTPAGDEAVLSVLTSGETFADGATFTGDRYPATASAVTRARLLTIPTDHVVNCIRGTPEIALAMLASTSQHLHRMAQRIEQLTAQSAIQRVADFLISLAPCKDAPCKDGPCTIALPYDKSLIAGRLGLKPESLSRVFAKLRSVGVEVRASHVVVNEMARLLELLASDRVQARGSCPGALVRVSHEQPEEVSGRDQAVSSVNMT